MERYFFNQENGDCVPDIHGTQLPSLDAAKDASVQVLVERLKANSGALWRTGAYRVVVTDADRLTLFALEVSTVLAPAVSNPGSQGGAQD